MAPGRVSFGIGLVAAALMATVGLSMLSPPAAANPGCSLNDLASAVSDTVKNFKSSCISEFSDFAFYALTASLGATAGAGASSQVADACSSVESALSQAASAAKTLKDLRDQLNSMGAAGSAIKTFLKDGFGLDVDDPNADPNKLVASASSALQPLTCACNVVTDPGFNELGNDVGACITEALNYLDCQIFNECGNPRTPQQIDCTVSPCPGQPSYNCSPVDNPNKALWGDAWNGIENQTQCSSDVCVDAGTGEYCYCPAAMQHWVTDPFSRLVSYLSCSCPDDLKPLGTTGGAQYVCVCADNTKPRADGSCPPPPPACNPSCPNNQVATISDRDTCSFTCACGSGQTNIGDRCVTPCADEGKVRLANGSCCMADQVTSCGACCPLGMKPDLATGACVTNFNPKPSVPQLPRQPQTPRIP